MESISGSLAQLYTTYTTMYYKPFSETGRSQCGYTLSRRGGGERFKGSCKGFFAREERRLKHEQAWVIKKGWHKGIRRDVRGKRASDPEACKELVDSQLSNAGKGRHLMWTEIANGGNQLIENTALLCCERAAESAGERKTDLMTHDKPVVNNMGDRLWGLDQEREFADRSPCSQSVKYMRGWHAGDARSWIVCEGDADDPSFSISWKNDS
jgi:hypothetical protein